MHYLVEQFQQLFTAINGLSARAKAALGIAVVLFLFAVYHYLTPLQMLAGGIFMVGYFLICIEHVSHVNKSGVALVMGVLVSLLAILYQHDHFDVHLEHSGYEIFELVVFLLAAMSLIEVLVHYQFFDYLQEKLQSLGLNSRSEFLVVTSVAFFLSAIIDNLTTTIVMTQISRKIFRGENLVRTVAMIVIAANAGGAFSPLGDVTTIMIWLADKFTATEVVWTGFLPSVVIYLVAAAMIFPSINSDSDIHREKNIPKLNRSEWVVISLVFLSFSFPLMMSGVGLPPYLGLLLGLGVVWMFVDILKQYRQHPSHLDASIEKFMKQTDISTLKFFIGILLAVGGLGHMGILDKVATGIFGASPSILRLVIGNTFLGLLSALVDNVPLTAIAIKIVPTDMASIWVLLAITVGTGGSVLIIGSAAGVVAMGMLKELNFLKYLRIASVPALVSYLVGVLVWWFLNGPKA